MKFMEKPNTLAPLSPLCIMRSAYCESVLRRYQHFPNAFSALSVVHIIGSSFSAVVRLQSGPENRQTGPGPGSRRQLWSRFTEETISKIPKNLKSILCDKQQARQRFLVAVERGREGDAFRQLTLGQNGDGGIKEGDCESSRLATCALTAQVVQAKENVDLEGLWADENCGQNAEKIADIWIFIVSNMCCHLLDAGCNIDNSTSVFSGARWQF